jgi:hypothetical protein
MEKPVAEECFCVNGFPAQKACPQFAPHVPSLPRITVSGVPGAKASASQ